MILESPRRVCEWMWSMGCRRGGFHDGGDSFVILFIVSFTHLP